MWVAPHQPPIESQFARKCRYEKHNHTKIWKCYERQIRGCYEILQGGKRKYLQIKEVIPSISAISADTGSGEKQPLKGMGERYFISNMYKIESISCPSWNPFSPLDYLPSWMAMLHSYSSQLNFWKPFFIPFFVHLWQQITLLKLH